MLVLPDATSVPSIPSTSGATPFTLQFASAATNYVVWESKCGVVLGDESLRLFDEGRSSLLTKSSVIAGLRWTTKADVLYWLILNLAPG